MNSTPRLFSLANAKHLMSAVLKMIGDGLDDSLVPEHPDVLHNFFEIRRFHA